VTAPRPAPGINGWLAMLLICASAALAAGLEALLVPLYTGSTLVPVAVLAALATNIALPLLARTVVPSMLGVALPFVAWLLVIIGFGVFGRPEGDVILPGGNAQWVAYGVLLGGALAGTVTVVTIAPRLAAPAARERPLSR
jgi:hypothetical protein